MKSLCTFFLLAIFTSFSFAQEIPTIAETDNSTEVAVQESDIDTQDSASDLGSPPEPEAADSGMVGESAPMPMEAGTPMANPNMGCCGSTVMNMPMMAGNGCCGQVQPNCCSCQPTCCNYQPACNSCCQVNCCPTTCCRSNCCRTTCCKVRVRRCRIFRRCR